MVAYPLQNNWFVFRLCTIFTLKLLFVDRAFNKISNSICGGEVLFMFNWTRQKKRKSQTAMYKIENVTAIDIGAFSNIIYMIFV